MFDFPIFFIQQRIGKNEIPFNLIKFRTLKNEPGELTDRKFAFGSFLRFLSLDELPQLVNVLKGEMSLIGPRPLPMNYLTLFSTAERQRHSVRPGITGWAQVNGRNNITWQEKFRLDIAYVKNISLFLDVKIFVKTILLVLSFKTDSSLQEKPFTGSSQ